MNNDGFGQVGAGQNDMRQAGNDLQHYTEKPYDRKTALSEEQMRHKQAKLTRLQHLEDHYNR